MGAAPGQELPSRAWSEKGVAELRVMDGVNSHHGEGNSRPLASKSLYRVCEKPQSVWPEQPRFGLEG